ncbi:MAG: hypothetical protein ABSD75_33735 [Terriglobales bacterium]|jgi:hypothetical protein
MFTASLVSEIAKANQFLAGLDEIRTGELTADDALANLQSTEQNASIKSYKAMWIKLRDKLDPIFAAQSIPRPKTFEEAFKNGSPKLFPGMGKGFYDSGLRFDAELRGEKIEPDTDMATVQHFIDNCLPFRALLLCPTMALRPSVRSKERSALRFRFFEAEEVYAAAGIACGDQLDDIRKCTAYCQGVAGKGGQQYPSINLPHLQCLVVRGGDCQPPVPTHRHAVDSSGVALHGAQLAPGIMPR